MDCSLPGSSVHGILQARILEWVAIPFSRGSSQPRDQTQVSCIVGRFFTIWVLREDHWPQIPSMFVFVWESRYFSVFLKIFFNVDHFKSRYWICYNIASVVCFGFLALRHVGSYFPNQGSHLHPCIGRWSLNHRTTRKVPLLHFLKDTFARYSILGVCFVFFSQNFTLYLLAFS